MKRSENEPAPRIAADASDQQVSPDALVVTVHGTFARRASWAKPDSTLGRAIVDSFATSGRTALVSPFQWSGRNSVRARRAAGSGLADHLDRISRDNPRATLYVVAHSHGGSVFAYAVKSRPDLSDKVEGFVALATPWLGFEPCSFYASLRVLLVKLAMFAALAASLFPLPSIIQLIFLLVVPRPGSVPDFEAALHDGSIVGPSAVAWHADPAFTWAPVLAAGAIGAILFFPLQRWVSRRLERSMSAFHQRLLRVASESSTLDTKLPPSVFLKPKGDEAALALTLSSAATALAQAISTLLFVGLQWLRDLWMRAPTGLRLVLGVLALIVWTVGTVQLEGIVAKLYHELTMQPVHEIR